MSWLFKALVFSSVTEALFFLFFYTLLLLLQNVYDRKCKLSAYMNLDLISANYDDNLSHGFQFTI